MEYHKFDKTITFLYNHFGSGPMDQMLCKEFYYKAMLSFGSAEQNRLGNFVRGSYKKHLCEIILNFEFGPVVQEMLFKIFLIHSSAGHLVWWSRPI